MARIVITGIQDTDNHQTWLQGALDALDAVGGGELFIADGTHYIGPGNGQIPGVTGAYSLKIGDNIHLRLGRAATLVRQFEGFSDENAIIRNANLNGNSNIRVSGGTLTTESDENPGRHLGFRNVANLRVDGMRFMGVFEDWNTSFLDCFDVIIADLVMNSGTTIHTDGLHFSGGSRITITNCIIICGDDCLAVTHEETFPQTEPTTDLVASNCYFWSKAANAVRLHIFDFEEPYEYEDRAIRRIQINNVVAKVGVAAADAGAGIVIVGPAGLHLVSDIQIGHSYLDANENDGLGVKISGVDRVKLTQVIIYQPLQYVAIEGSDHIDLRDCTIDSPRQSSMPCVVVANEADCRYLRILGGYYKNARHHGIILGSTNFTVGDFEVSNAVISDGDLNGLQVENATNGIVIGNTIRDQDDWGILESSASSKNVYIANRLYDNDDGPILVQGTNSHASRNYAAFGVQVADTGGFRQTIDGWYHLNISGTLGATLMTRGNGRFRAVRPGSITGLILTTSAVQSSGSMTATIFKKTGVASGTGSTTLLSVTLNTTNSLAIATFAENATAAAKFAAGDELYLEISSTSWRDIVNCCG